MSTSNKLNRTCSSCGIEKPLSSFLQLIEGKGTNYGLICSSCRSSNASSNTLTPKKVREADDTTSTTAGLKLGAKARLKTDLENKRINQHIKIQNKLDLKKRDLLQTEKEHVSGEKEEQEKLRKFQFETKKQDFITTTKPSTIPQSTFAPTHEKHVASVPIRDQKTHQIENKQLEDMADKELKLTTIDLTNQFFDPQFADVRHNSALFVQFKQWLGAASPLGRANAVKEMEKLKNSVSENPKQTKNDPLNEFISKNWEPNPPTSPSKKVR